MPGHTIGVLIPIASPYGEVLEAARARYEPAADDQPAHVTILPPIDVDAEAMAAVVSHLEDVARRTSPFRLMLRGTGTFRPVSPVVFVAVAEGIAACEQLEAQVRSGDLAVDTRFRYHPHVTVAHDVPEAVLDRAFAELSGFTSSQEVTSMALYDNVDGEWRLLRELEFLGGTST